MLNNIETRSGGSTGLTRTDEIWRNIMTQLKKKERTLEREFLQIPGMHTKEYSVGYCGSKTWIKDRHYKKAQKKVESGVGRIMPKERDLVMDLFEPEIDMDGSRYTRPEAYR